MSSSSPQQKKLRPSDAANPANDAARPQDEAQRLGSQLLDAAKKGDDEEVERLLAKRCDASYQDPDTGVSALMLGAAGGFGPVVSELLINGAPYNAVDKHGKCAGNYALENGHSRIVDALVDAGVTAELLFAKMAARREAKAKKAAATSVSEQAAAGDGKAPRHNDSTGAQVDYFKQAVRYTNDGQQLLDSTQDAVMMEWERPLMAAHAKVMIPDDAEPNSRDVLNIGFGMGIIDGCVCVFVCVEIIATASVTLGRF